MAKSATAILKSRSSTAWTGRKKNSAALMEVVVDACRHATGESGDWTVLAHVIARGISEGATPEVTNLKIVAKAILPGIVFKKDVKQPTGIKIVMGDATLSNSGVDAVSKLIDRKVSLTGTAIKSALVPDEEKEKPEFDPKAKAKRAVNGLTKEQVDQLIASLQVERKAM